MKNQITVTANVIGTFRNALTGKITGQFKAHNLVVDTGLTAIASRLSGTDNPATKGSITYCALGTGTAAVDHADTKLQTETIRKQVSARNYSGVVAQFRTFYNTSEGNVTIKEIGLFGDAATITPDSGTLFARLAVDKEKTSAETLTLDWQITIGAS